MRKWYIILLSVCFCMNSHAQERRQTIESTTVKADSMPMLRPHSSGIYTHPSVEPFASDIHQRANDSLTLPSMNAYGQVMPINLYPYSWNGWHNWALHKGLNVNIGASVFGFIGKNTPRGAGFTQSLSAMYAMPLNHKLSLAVGGYLNNVMWSHSSYRDAGLSAVLGYRFDEHWEAYLYGQKSLAKTQRIPYPLYDMGRLGDRIGAAVKYNFNPNFSIQLSVEQGFTPNTPTGYFDQYNYPVPR